MRDTFGGEFSVTTAVAFVVGGIAALVLAAALALGGYGRADRPGRTGAVGGAATSRSGSSSAQPEAEVEYLLDTAEPASSAR
jgi:hypothetical protein